jgi:hypothetical protein
MRNPETKIIKFHGTQVKNIIVHYSTKQKTEPAAEEEVIEEFDALKSQEQCETINIQVVADYITITFYREESSNSIIRRELIPTYAVQHIWVEDLE